MNDTFGLIESTHGLGLKLKSIITTEDFDGFIKLSMDHVEFFLMN